MRSAEAFLSPCLMLAVTACSLGVDDQTPTPPQYNASAGFTVRAKPWKAGLLSSLHLATYAINLGTATTFPLNQQVVMAATSADPAVHEGRFPPPFGTIRLFSGCGFRVRHKVTSNFLGIWPVSAEAVKNVTGNPYAQHVSVEGLEVVFPSGGGQVTTRPTLASTYSPPWFVLVLVNGYDQTLTVSKTEVTCGHGQDCTTVPTPYVVDITLPTVPASLACGEISAVAFKCTEPAKQAGLGGEVKFETNLGSVVVPFACYPDGGA